MRPNHALSPLPAANGHCAPCVSTGVCAVDVMCVCMYACMHVCMRACMQVRRVGCIVCLRVRVHAHMHTCTHTNKRCARAGNACRKAPPQRPLLPKRTDVETTKYNTTYTNTIENNTAYTKTRTSEADAPENGQDGASTMGFTPDAATAAVPTGEEVATEAAPVSFVCGLGGRAPKIVDPTRTLLLPIRMASS